MTYDCFPFFNELDLVEIRLHTHNDFVDKFVIIEADQTHSGYKKPLFFQENLNRFEKFKEKIIYCPITFPIDLSYLNAIPVNNIDWKRENYQREHIKNILSSTQATNNDIVISSDLDEIINKEVFNRAKKIINEESMVRVKQNHYAYKLNYFCGADTDGVIIATYNNVKKYNLTSLRAQGYNYNFTTIQGGWHFSFLSKIDRNVYVKFKSFSHAYENTDVTDEKTAVEKVKKCLIKQIVKIDDSFPSYIINNLEFFKEYIGS